MSTPEEAQAAFLALVEGYHATKYVLVRRSISYFFKSRQDQLADYAIFSSISCVYHSNLGRFEGAYDQLDPRLVLQTVHRLWLELLHS